ncbi:MAG: acetylglutamate kinase [Nannocystaceae bacterium]|nr:acetylglutamate kinase [Nannocystaceae bacterium]
MTKTVVLKFGGEVVADGRALRGVLDDVATLWDRDYRFVLCHGGGPQAGALQARLQLPVVKVGGRRVTDEATLLVMKQVLAGEVSVDVVAAAVAAGLRAVGVCGVSDGLVSAHRRPPTLVSGGGDAPVDFGLVGDIDLFRTELLTHLWAGGFCPVLNTLGVDRQPTADGLTRQVYNINADTVAAAIAGAIGADHLMLITAIGGVMRDKNDPSTRIPRLTAAQARAAIAEGTIVGGMIPKIEEALDNLAAGIGAVHILPPGPGVIAAAAEQPGRVGTVLVARDG